MESCILLAIIVILIIFGVVCCFHKSKMEKFTDWTQNCPQGKTTMLSPRMAYGEPWTPQGYKKFNDYIGGSYSPGSVFKCKNAKNCPNIQVKGCSRREDIPLVRESLPLGWGSTMTGPYAGNNCMSNVNGVNKVSGRNPYGKLYPEGNQMYSFCEKGVDNYFDN